MKTLELLTQKKDSLSKRISRLKQRAELTPKGPQRDKIVAQILFHKKDLKSINNKIAIQKRLISTHSIDIDESKIIRFPLERSRLKRA